MTIEQTLTDEERLANLSLEQLQKLVGLVEHTQPVTGFRSAAGTRWCGTGVVLTRR